MCLNQKIAWWTSDEDWTKKLRDEALVNKRLLGEALKNLPDEAVNRRLLDEAKVMKLLNNCLMKLWWICEQKIAWWSFDEAVNKRLLDEALIKLWTKSLLDSGEKNCSWIQ
jgi:hypothetical protein